ncbi:MAG TPA: acyl carrier protein [Candidatus Dormibacteraeota bacterium]|nr:acyl carrier protein [Candidatus Dormibacteraeota bacterium]
MNESTTRVREIVATILAVPVEEITDEASTRTVEAWTSLRHLVLALELEQEFGIEVGPDDMERVGSVAGIVELLSERGAAV